MASQRRVNANGRSECNKGSDNASALELIMKRKDA